MHQISPRELESFQAVTDFGTLRCIVEAFLVKDGCFDHCFGVKNVVFLQGKYASLVNVPVVVANFSLVVSSVS